MKAQKIEKKLLIKSKVEFIKTQLILYFTANSISFSEYHLIIISYILLEGMNKTLPQICEDLVEQDLFSSIQYARNLIVKLEKQGMIYKKGKNRKEIYVSNDILKAISIPSSPVLLSYNILYYESTEG